MVILDTNVVSALMALSPEKLVVNWLDQQPGLSIWITSVTVFEIEVGLQIMPPGKRRSGLVQAFKSLLGEINQRVVAFDLAAAQHAADLMAARRRKGSSGELRDTMIAGIALAHNAILATRNTAHFQDLPIRILNPWTKSAT